MKKQNNAEKITRKEDIPYTNNKGFSQIQHEVMVVLFLVASILVIYWQVHGFQFLSFDDPQYVAQNAQVQKGLSLDNFFWAFSFYKQGDLGYWYPLTWLSHMMDCQLFGLNPGLHHLSNVFFHILNSILLFIALRLMTGSVGKSAFIACLFALHPINVDSVAWIAERKNLLSTTFWMLTMISYFFYTKKKTLSLYLLTFVMFCLGSLAKPMLVTLPFVLLLLDYWPLERVRVLQLSEDKGCWEAFYRNTIKLAIEKTPFIIASFVFIFININLLSVNFSNTVTASHLAPMDLKVKNAIVSYMVYIGKMFWPNDLSIFHPYPESVPWWQVLSAIMALITITALVFSRFRKSPYLITGWLWFLGTMVPVLGIVQAGLWPAIGERWAYVPFIGLFIMVTWGVADLLSKFNNKRIMVTIAAAAVLMALSLQAWTQTGYWKDNISIFSHSLKIDNNNYVAHVNLAAAYANNKEYTQATHHFQEALRIHATDVLALDGLGRIYKKLGQYDKSVSYYSQIIKYNPQDVKAYLELGSVLASKGDFDNAIRQYQQVISLDPQYAPAYYSLGVISAQKQELSRAIEYFSNALRINPNDIDSHCSIGVILMNQGRIDEAIGHFKEALRIDPQSVQSGSFLSSATLVKKINEDINRLEQERGQKPDNPQVYQKLAMLYANKGDNARALGMLQEMARLKPGDPSVYYNMACVYAKQGKVDNAIGMLKKSMDKGFKDWDLLKRDKDLDSLRATQFYKDLIKRAN